MSIPSDGLTPEQAATVAKATVAPTIQRMVHLTTGLLHMTGNADFALFAPLATMSDTMGQLKWTDPGVPAEVQLAFRKMLRLASFACSTYAAKMDAFRLELHNYQDHGGPPPTWPGWTNEDTLKAYDFADQAEGHAVASAPPPAAEGAANERR